jgi:hypothetical protein
MQLALGKSCARLKAPLGEYQANRQFRKGSPVKLAISEVPPASPVPSLEEYRRSSPPRDRRFRSALGQRLPRR